MVNNFFFSPVTGQKVIGEPVVSGLVLNDSGLWDPDFITAAKQEASSIIFSSFIFHQLYKYFEVFCSSLVSGIS